MIFYKIEADIVNAKTFSVCDDDNGSERPGKRKKSKKFRDSDEWKSFKDFSSQHSDEIFRKSDNKTYIFTSGIKQETVIQLGIISRCDVDTENIVRDYLTLIDAKFKKPVIDEVTLHSIINMLQISCRNDLIKDDDVILERFDLSDLSRRSYRGIDYSEVILNDEIRENALISKAGSLLCNETLVSEIERIYQVPAKAAEKGHPVHYMIQCNDSQVTEQMTRVLLSALYDNKRIRSRRSCTVTFDNDYDFPAQYFESLCRSCFGSVMVFKYGDDLDNDDEYAKPDMDVIDKLCDTIKKYKNDMLTILCISRSNEKVRSALFESLGSVTIIPLKEDVVFGERAKKYLRQLVKNQGAKADKSLYSTIRDNEKGYLASDLNSIFDHWYSKKLKTRVFPQYAEFESASTHAAKEKPKGSAYSEMEKMIGLSEVKSVINQALDFYKAQKLFKDKGIPLENTAMHMVFTGNPGTAKTTAARLFAQIMKDNGLLSEGKLFEVGRADLVGRFVGWTAPIVKQKFKNAKGSVLFIDEAYSLVDDRDGLYGDEAINTIVQEMENNREDMVVIFAGYPDKMEAFLQKNPGLRSRIAFHVQFKNYDQDELYQITQLLAENKKLSLATCVKDKLLSVFKEHKEYNDFGNG